MVHCWQPVHFLSSTYRKINRTFWFCVVWKTQKREEIKKKQFYNRRKKDRECVTREKRFTQFKRRDNATKFVIRAKHIFLLWLCLVQC